MAHDQLTGSLFDIPDPPTGPRAMPAAANTLQGYWRWRESEDGRTVWRAIERWALEQYPGRISAKALVERARNEMRREVNNTYTAWIGDDLVRRHPHLLDAIERRARKKVA